MEMTDVVSVNAGRVGVMLQDGEMKIISGRSTDTEFGFFWTKHLMESADFKYGCVVNLEFENVDHGFYAGGLNLIIDDRVRTAPDLSKNPSPRPSIDPLRSCIQVPFDCSWCGD